MLPSLNKDFTYLFTYLLTYLLADAGKSAETIVPNSNSESPNGDSLPPAQTSRYGQPIQTFRSDNDYDYEIRTWEAGTRL